MKQIILACMVAAFAFTVALPAAEGQCPMKPDSGSCTNKVSCPGNKDGGCCPKDGAGAKTCPMKDSTPAKK